jgi:hypothetical protein
MYIYYQNWYDKIQDLGRLHRHLSFPVIHLHRLRLHHLQVTNQAEFLQFHLLHLMYRSLIRQLLRLHRRHRQIQQIQLHRHCLLRRYHYLDRDQVGWYHL